MIKSSKSYHTLKEQIQLSVDFVLLCCHSMPALKGYIKAVEKGGAEKIPNPDIFKNTAEYDRLKQIIPNYRKTIGRFLVLSSFSYFESYVSDVIDELFLINGGEAEFLKMVKDKRDDYFEVIASLNERAKKLREEKDKSKIEKYRKIIDELTRSNYKFPSELLAFYGIFQLQEKLINMRACDIPDIMENALGIKIEEDERTEFHRIRERRNGIAHGKITEVDLSEAIQINNFLKNFAKKVDQHIIRNFFVIESAT
ncbi:MAG: HEPN domain-containing protein [Cyanobacteria bacterium P01_A01_bin.123]